MLYYIYEKIFQYYPKNIFMCCKYDYVFLCLINLLKIFNFSKNKMWTLKLIS